MNLPFPDAPPNFLSTFVQAKRLGQEDRRTQARDNALSMYGTDPEGSINALTPIDPERAAALSTMRRAGQQRDVLKRYQTDPTGAREAAFAVNLETVDMVSRLDASAQAKLKAQEEVFAKIGLHFLKVAPGDDPQTVAQRKATLLTMAPELEAKYGVPRAAVEQFDPTTNNIKERITRARTLTGILEEQAKTAEHDWKEVTKADGSTEFIDLNDPKSRMATGAPSAQPAGGGGLGQGGFDAIYGGFVAPQEGGYTPSDGNGAPANFGINQKANPDVDVRSLTPDRAKQLYQERYWKPSGAENLPPPLQAVHFDTAVNMGVGAAKELLQQSGGDSQKYLQLREQRYRAIAARDPSKADELPVWLRRNRELGQFVSGPASSATDAGRPASGRIAGSAPKGERLATEAEKRTNGLDPSLPYRVGPGNKFSLPEGVKPTGAGDLPSGAGLTKLGNGFFRDRLGRIYQPNNSGVLQQTAGIGDAEIRTSMASISGINQLLQAVHQFDKAADELSLADFGPMGKYAGDPGKYAAAKAAATNLQMLLKGPAAYNLGVLTGPDLAILEGVVADPAKFDTMVRQRQIKPALRQLSRGLGTRYVSERQAFEALGGDPSGLPGLWSDTLPSVRANRAAGRRANEGGGIPTVSPEQAAKLPKGAKFRTTDGRVMTRQ